MRCRTRTGWGQRHELWLVREGSVPRTQAGVALPARPSSAQGPFLLEDEGVARLCQAGVKTWVLAGSPALTLPPSDAVS